MRPKLDSIGRRRVRRRHRGFSGRGRVHRPGCAGDFDPCGGPRWSLAGALSGPARRAKTEGIDAEMPLRARMAWRGGELWVCSMVPIPDEADEEARRAPREGEDLIGERRPIVTTIDGLLATLGVQE
jgi:hypothetical protein